MTLGTMQSVHQEALLSFSETCSFCALHYIRGGLVVTESLASNCNLAMHPETFGRICF